MLAANAVPVTQEYPWFPNLTNPHEMINKNKLMGEMQLCFRAWRRVKPPHPSAFGANISHNPTFPISDVEGNLESPHRMQMYLPRYEHFFCPNFSDILLHPKNGSAR